MSGPASAIASEVTTTVATNADATSISRASLLDGSLMATFRKQMAVIAPEVRIYTNEEMAKARATILKQRPIDEEKVWIFAYGSLMWNPAFNYTDRINGTVLGWSRQLNLWMFGGRGSREKPGLTLGLEKGGSTEGVVLSLPFGKEELELSLVWQREAWTDAYIPKWVKVETNQGIINAITFTSNPNHDWYAGRLEEEEIAQLVSCASGSLGTCIEYVDNTLESLKSLNFRDHYLERIQVRAKQLSTN